MRTDWSKRTDPVAYQNFDETGQHTPGPDVSAVRFLVEERDVLGFGTETIGTDAGQAAHFRPPYPCHTLHARRRPLRSAMSCQSRPAAADRRGRDRGATENPARQRQPGTGVGNRVGPPIGIFRYGRRIGLSAGANARQCKDCAMTPQFLISRSG